MRQGTAFVEVQVSVARPRPVRFADHVLPAFVIKQLLDLFRVGKRRLTVTGQRKREKKTDNAYCADDAPSD